MAITWTPTVRRVRAVGDVKEVHYDVSSGAGGTYTYTDNGDTLTKATLQLDAVEFALCTPAVTATPVKAYVVYWDWGTEKVVLYGGAAANTGLAELTAAHDVGTLAIFRLVVFGKGPVSGPAM